MMWRSIAEFPRYSISRNGEVVNNRGHSMVLTRNQQGIVQVGLVRDGKQFKRSVALLVAKAFLPTPTLEAFNTPIHLDGDRFNTHAENLMWRPRWFAVKYHAQFRDNYMAFSGPIVEIHSREKFPNSRAAVITYGLLERDIYMATLNRTYVFPTYQEFRELNE